SPSSTAEGGLNASTWPPNRNDCRSKRSGISIAVLYERHAGSGPRGSHQSGKAPTSAAPDVQLPSVATHCERRGWAYRRLNIIATTSPPSTEDTNVSTISPTAAQIA